MASSQEYLQYVLELLVEVKNVTYRKMMGEFILYKNGVIFGGVYDDRFLVKKTNLSKKEGLKEVIPYPNAKPMLLVETEDTREIYYLVNKVYRDLTKQWNRYDMEGWKDDKVKKLADQGNPSCIFEYGLRLYEKEQYEESYKYLIQISKGDNFYILERIIEIAYYYCKGIMSDEELFALLLRRHNHSSSFYSYILAYFYRDGRGCKKDLDKYIELLKICSSDGSSHATHELAECYEKGFGVPQSYEEAFKVYYYWVDDHCRMDYWCAYKAAYYMYHEIGGAKKDMDNIEYHLRYACRVHEEARKLYKEIFGKEVEL